MVAATAAYHPAQVRSDGSAMWASGSYVPGSPQLGRTSPMQSRRPSLTEARQLEAASMQPVARRSDSSPAHLAQAAAQNPSSRTPTSGHLMAPNSGPSLLQHCHRHAQDDRQERRSLEHGRKSWDNTRPPDWQLQAAVAPAAHVAKATLGAAEQLQAIEVPSEGGIRTNSEFLHALKGLQVPAAPRVTNSASEQENAYLRKNIEHLRHSKRILEAQVISLESRATSLDQQNAQYKALYEQLKGSLMVGNSGELEISNLHQQLSAVLMLKDALNTENIDLQRRLQEAQAEDRNESKHTACVICLDNLANMVCLPCKHLALCTFCGQQQGLSNCPICRSNIDEKLQIYMP